MSVELLAFTDPVCTWCWGSEPVLRKVETWYDDSVLVHYVMGGLVEDITAFYDAVNDIGGDPERSNVQIARHWLEASARHGMPVKTEGFRLFTVETTSTYPQNIAFKAAELTSPGLASRYLRRIREASAAEARETGRPEVLIELASEVGLDVTDFVMHFSDGSAEEAFRGDLGTTRRYGVRGFPTFLFQYRDKELMLRGYQDFRAMHTVIDTLTGGTLHPQAPEQTEDEVLRFLRIYGRAAPVEVTTVFDLSPREYEAIVDGLEDENLVRRVSAGNGYFLEPAAGASCDVERGTCAL
jgi:putative protein-disulfide isomerase